MSSSIFFGCPAEAALTSIPTPDCVEQVGQIQKLMFQRVYETGTTKNSMTILTDDPKLLATWTALKSAVDGTKVIVSPYVSEPASEPGAVREYGGGNATLGGIPITLGKEAAAFAGKFLMARQDVIAAIKDIQKEGALAHYLISEHGYIGGIVDDIETPLTFEPIPIYNIHVGDKKLGGLEESDSNEITFKKAPNWSDRLLFIKPTDFDALTEL